MFIRRARFREAAERRTLWERCDDDAIRRLQLTRLRRVWRDATNKVEYYRRLVTRGEAPPTFETIQQFSATVPLLTRRDLQTNQHLFRRIDHKAYRVLMTAGSTGVPLHMPCFQSELRNTGINQLAGRIANGLTIDDKVFLLWGHAHLLGTGFERVLNTAARHAKDRLLGYKRCDAYKLDHQSARAHMRAMLSFRPRIVIGYSNALDILVRANSGYREEARSLNLKFIVATGEVLPRSDTKAILEDFFRCRLVMEYGGVDFGVVAYQRPEASYKIFWCDYLVETQDCSMPAGGSGESPLIVSTLYDRYVPLLRYVNGDEISSETVVRTADGMILEFAEMRGRHHDTVKMNNGETIHSMGIFHCIHQEQCVHSIQLVLQDTGPKLVLVGSDCDGAAMRRIRQRLIKLSPEFAGARIEVAPDLLTNAAGKRRWIVDQRTTASAPQ